jgi:hypothetical protein
MEHVSKKIGIQVGSELFTDTNDADDGALLVGKQEDYETALRQMEAEASKLGLHVSWAKSKLQNLGYGPPMLSSSSITKTLKQSQNFDMWAADNLAAPTPPQNVNAE